MKTTGIDVVPSLAAIEALATVVITETPPPNQVGRQLRHSLELIVRPAVVDRDVLPFDVVCFLQALTKRPQSVGNRLRRRDPEDANHRKPGLLRMRGERPSRCRAA